MKHSKITDDMVFSVDTFDAFTDKQMQQWMKNDDDGYMNLKEDNFDVENDIEQLERLLEESDYCEKKKLTEQDPQSSSTVAMAWSTKNRD